MDIVKLGSFCSRIQETEKHLEGWWAWEGLRV